jgi:hypothetical protein
MIIHTVKSKGPQALEFSLNTDTVKSNGPQALEFSWNATLFSVLSSNRGIEEPSCTEPFIRDHSKYASGKPGA